MLPKTFDEAFEQVAKLVAIFKANEAHYLSPEYQEAEARKDFIDKFWIALGWDVNHDHQPNPYEQEVKVERSISAAGQRHADYAFYLAPNFRDVHFFVEAKKPSVEIETKENYFQLIRYGWNSETPLAVLTDFEQFHILDCRYKPDPATALNRRVAKYHYSEYLRKDKFAEIYWLFSREAITGGSLEKRSAELLKPRGKAVQRGLLAGGWQSIDESFLQELNEYRIDLAKAFKKHNPGLDSEQLTECTQRAIDRLVFIRFLEDKGIEAQRLVDKFGDRGTAWEDFVAASRRLDGIYNGIVFKDHPIIDQSGFRVDDDLFADICEKLSHVNSPYDFNAIPIHILGSIYEQFLGKVIVATDKRVHVDEKPEVRKAGGVYYTHECIGRYIIEHTVGKLISGKTPDQISAMRFADIACGSGSFLLGVYDLLLTYHGYYYNQNPAKAKKGDCVKRDGKLYLSLRKKRDILTNNIFGVDVDAQAVEVCQLSLYLKLLKDETTTSAHQYLLDFEKQALLPSLNKNIVCGNSLIGTDILDDQLFPGDEERRLNPMNFEDAFAEIMKRNGFDAIVGNPPWGVEFSDLQQSYLRAGYEVAKDSTIDSYSVFIERALAKLKPGGLLGYIVPDTFLRKDDYVSLRRLFLTHTEIHDFVETGPVFPQVRDTWCLVFTVSKAQPTATSKIRHRKISRFIVSPEERLKLFEEGQWESESFIDQSVWMNRPQMIVAYLALAPAQRLIAKTETHPRLGTMLDKYRISRGEEGSKFALKETPDSDFFMVIPENIERYAVDPGMRVSERSLTKTKVASLYTHPKIWIIRIQKMRWKQRIVCGLDGRLKSAGMKTLQIIVSSNDNIDELKYLTGILASSLVNFWCINYLADDMNQSYLAKLPIRNLDLTKPVEKAQFDAVVSRVDAMLATKTAQAGAKTEKDKTYYENKFAGLDRQLNRLVFDLYGLSGDESALVESIQQ